MALLMGGLGIVPAVAADATVTVPMRFSLSSTDAPQKSELPPAAIEVSFPEDRELFLWLGEDAVWHDLDQIRITLALPSEAPPDVEALLFLKDRDGFWFQHLFTPALAPGATNHLQVAFDSTSTDWQAVGHQGGWHYRTRLDPETVGLRLFSAASWSGPIEMRSVAGAVRTAEAAPPGISQLSAASLQVPIRERFELRFALPDRYTTPFDPETVEIWATIQPPVGEPIRVDAFYYQDFFVRTNRIEDVYIPQGNPHWRLRYAPRHPGMHQVRLFARDASGSTAHEGLWFEALAEPAGAPFVRVSKRDHRFFEGCDDTPFFPIGHNIRSPFDTRMDEQFPWRFRHPEAARVYDRYFRDMAGAGQNFVEIWLCNWSLGLEWTPTRPGYHGMGEYNLMHSWQLDRVVEAARKHGIYINLVLKNHGRLSGWVDPEWAEHPINAANGGYLDDPMDFFDHPRAIADYQRQLRYLVSRWGYAPHIFAWELWSELDLIGLRRPDPHPQHDPRVHAWHRLMGDYLQSIDPNRRLRASHLSSTFRIQNETLASMPQLDFNPLNAYHHSTNPLQTAELLRQTVDANRRYNKPVLITEFGGSHMAASTAHIHQDLRIGIWTATATALSGTPLFWWWQVIEEQNWYPLYHSLSRYMAGVDRRDPELQPVSIDLRTAEGNPIDGNWIDRSAIASPHQAFAYLAVQPVFRQRAAGNREPAPPQEGLQARLAVGTNAHFAVTFWDIDRGEPLRRMEVRARDGQVAFELPPFEKDLAFRLRRLDPDADPPAAE